MTEMPTIRDNKGKDIVVPLSSMCCPACQSHIANPTDKFCRSCGMRILMICNKCQSSVRPSDKYCPSCGARRWALFEMWRHGMLHKSTTFVALSIIIAGSSWLALYAWMKTRYRY